jgi:4-diphosphocytidyl-2-C-methyl-D-erythritol kinase
MSPNRVLSVRPPAKLNRFLHIVGRRADGYHLLQTAFDLIDWCDELEIADRADGIIERRGGLAGVAPDSDLVVRAARRLQQQTGATRGCTLTLRKHIPTGAGLGGGSADAAAVLLGLNRLWNLDLGVQELIDIGVELGADVPVFIAQQPAFATGVGEILTALPYVARSYAVIFPGVALPTGPMFADPALRRDCPAMDPSAYNDLEPGNNVFAPLARAREPAIVAAMDCLQQRLGSAHLSGSGSAVFAQAPDLDSASHAVAGLPPGWIGRAASTITNWFDKISPGA